MVLIKYTIFQFIINIGGPTGAEPVLIVSLSLLSVMSVCFDGASTMSGSTFERVQAIYKVENKNILKYVHFYDAHCINIALVDYILCEKVKSASGL